MNFKKKLLLALAFVMGVVSVAYATDPGKIPDIFGKTYSDQAFLRFGKHEDALLGYDTDQTNPAVLFGLSTESERFILTQKADIGTDFSLSDAGTPTLTIMNSDPSKYLELYHDGTNAVLSTSTGVLTLPAGTTVGGSTLSNTGFVIEGATADDYETTFTFTDPTADRTVTVPDASGTLMFSSACTSIVTAAVNPTEAGATTDYVNLVDNTFSATEADEDMFTVPASLIAANLYAEADVAPGVGNDAWVVTLRADGSDTPLTCQIDESATTCNNGGTANVNSGQKLTVSIVSSGPDSDPSAAGEIALSFCLRAP